MTAPELQSRGLGVPEALPHHEPSPMRLMVLLGAVVVYALVLASCLSSRHLMVLDEFFAWNLLSDPSWLHALASWNQGADSGGILYYALLWPVVQLTHGSVLAARLFSAVCYVLAAIVWWRSLSRFTGARSAALGVALVWLSAGPLLVYIAQVRFYTPLLLFAALAVWATLRSANAKIPLGLAAVFVACAHVGLVLIHMLGILYSGLIVAGTLLSVRPRRRAVLLAASGILSWLALLPCRTAIHSGSANATSQAVPVFRDVLRFHLKSAASVPVLLVAFLGLVWLSASTFQLFDRATGAQQTPSAAPSFVSSFWPAHLACICFPSWDDHWEHHATCFRTTCL